MHDSLRDNIPARDMWKYGLMLGFGLNFIAAGFRYSPDYMAGIFSATGQLPERFVRMVRAFDISSIIFGFMVLSFSRRLYRHRDAFFTILISTAVTLFALEGVLRVYFHSFAASQQAQYLPGNDITLKPVYSRHHYLGYYPTPNYVSPDGRNRHNSLGYRGEEFPLKKPDGEYRIVLIGGSSTYDEEVRDFRQSCPYQLEELLHNKYGHSNVRVINAGVGGYDTFQSLINLEFRILDLQPDLIIINHNINDVHTRMVNPSYFKGDNSGRRRPWQAPGEPVFMNSVLVRYVMTRLTGVSFEPALDQYYTSLHSLTGVIGGEFNPVLGDTPMNTLKKNPPVYFERNLKNMIAIAETNNIKVLLMTWPYSLSFNDYMNTPHYRYAVEEQNEVIRDVAHAFPNQGVYLYELDRDMPREGKFWADGRHVNEAGAAVKAQLIAEYLEDFILRKVE